MPNITQVLNKFTLYSGIEPNDTAPFEPLCEECLCDVISELRDEVNTDTYSSKICCIAAALAFYRFTLQKASRAEETDITLGNLRVASDANNTPESAYKLYSQIKASARNLFKDEEFFFSGVAIS